jgi:hypothetical protein
MTTSAPPPPPPPPRLFGCCDPHGQKGFFCLSCLCPCLAFYKASVLLHVDIYENDRPYPMSDRCLGVCLDTATVQNSAVQGCWRSYALRDVWRLWGSTTSTTTREWRPSPRCPAYCLCGPCALTQDYTALRAVKARREIAAAYGKGAPKGQLMMRCISRPC